MSTPKSIYLDINDEDDNAIEFKKKDNGNFCFGVGNLSEYMCVEIPAENKEKLIKYLERITKMLESP